MGIKIAGFELPINCLVSTARRHCIDKYEFTNSDYLKVIANTENCGDERNSPPADKKPFTKYASWGCAIAMCDSSEKRLCTDSEWKYAGRGGNAKCEYGTKNCLLPNDTNACYQKDTPCDVGSYPPNALGLYDMSGNVSEWVGKFSVYNLWTIRPELCGGSWESNLDKEKLKVDSCLDIAPEVMDPKYGFRCCKDLQE